MSDDLSLPTGEQSVRAFALVDRILAEAGTDRTRIISATVILHDIEDKSLVAGPNGSATPRAPAGPATASHSTPAIASSCVW